MELQKKYSACEKNKKTLPCRSFSKGAFKSSTYRILANNDHLDLLQWSQIEGRKDISGRRINLLAAFTVCIHHTCIDIVLISAMNEQPSVRGYK